MKTRYLIIPFLFVLAACQPMELEDPTLKDNLYSDGEVLTLTVQATKGGTETKALDLVNSDSRLNAYWKSTEKVQVYKDGVLMGTLDVTPGSGEKPTTATLSGTLDNVDGLAAGSELTLLIPRTTWVYTGQNGLLVGDGSIENAYDYAKATVTIATISGGSITTTGSANFENQQSIYRFTFTGIDGISIQDFSISSSNNALVRKMSWGENSEEKGSITVTPTVAGPYYVALHNTLAAPSNTVDDTYTFSITGTVNSKSNALLMATKTIPQSVLKAQGFFISGTITVSQPDFSPSSGEITSSTEVL